MNDIIEKLIEWCEENNYCVDLSIYGRHGGIFVSITLRKYEYKISHKFYVAGGKLSIQNWRMTNNNLELLNFLKTAEDEFENAQFMKESEEE